MLKEDEFTEFKKTTGELKEALISISAILNKHGRGKIFFGLKNNGEPSPFTINDSTLRNISRKIFETIRPQIFPAINTIKIAGSEVIQVNFEGNNPPYSAFGRYYIRTADEDRELTPEGLRKIMVSGEYEDNWESRPSVETIDDVDEETLHKFYVSSTSCGRLPNAGLDKVDLLTKLNVLSGTNLTNRRLSS